MKEYQKIQTVYKRDPDNKFKTLLEGEFSTPEFEYLANCEWVGTEKVDGTNIRVMFDATEKIVTVAGKTDRAEIPKQLHSWLSKVFIERGDYFSRVFDGAQFVCLYGEGYGAKIQKGGGKYSSEQLFVLFDVWVDGWWLRREDVDDIATHFDIDSVPVVFQGTLHNAIESCRQGFPSQWGEFIAEGLVLRPSVELKARNGKRIITKIKYKDF